jgi:hypothetical protein
MTIMRIFNRDAGVSASALLALTLAFLVSIGCTSVSIHTSGTHARDYPLWDKPHRYLVWGDSPTLTAAITQHLQAYGQTVVERAALANILAEQQIRLTYASDSDALRIGKLIGADQIVFTDYTVDRSHDYRADVDEFRVRVDIRAVDVETTAIRWSGSAWPDSLVTTSPETALSTLAYFAIERALCRIEDGYTWIEGNRCTKK